MTLFGKDNETFTSRMFLNLDQLQRQLDKDEFQEDKSMDAFWVIDNQFEEFIDWQYFMDYDSQMTKKFFAEYTRIKVTQFRETLIQHMGNVKKSVAERAHHQRQFERRVNNRQMQINGTESGMHDTSSSLGNYITHVVDTNIRPVNDQVPFAEVQLTAQHNVHANEQQHTDQSEPIYDIYLLEKFASQVDVINDLSKPFTPYYVPKVREYAFVKPHHVIASSSSRNSSNESYRSNDMAHKYYLEVNSRAKVQSPKTKNINKPVEPKSHTQEPDRQIAIGQQFSLNMSFAVREKPNTPRSCLRWILTVQASDLNVNKTASVDNTSGPALQRKERCTLQCALSLKEEKYSCLRPFLSTSFMLFHTRSVINSVSPTPYVPPSKKVYEILFQQLFDEYFNPPPRVVSPVLATVAAPRAVDLAGSPSSTTIDQDVPYASSSPTT
nr:hypothetical protein [Tanacetum cinerariifolium]